ncbi:MAG TPA: SpoIIE family protein phosphatase [Anaerolineae bacterium]|nr:SpoIIE family protein phosphatase [Anaerolineae bacterium]MCB0225771.1 SpoIIE family protein phosphatase [Anaerolineae bacterium]MCB9104856.1 SpoIIE family protein phosphatase [Anaerolineales bacterium]HRV95960.1 SpoIIE family protein phosphatase [Anaerolineae bacterium]
MSVDASSSATNPLSRELSHEFQPVDPEFSPDNAALDASRQQVFALRKQLAHEMAERRRVEQALQASEAGHRLMVERWQNDLELARQIQQSLLPPAIPKWPDLEVVCFTQPAFEVGGDFYAYHASRQARVLLNKYSLAIGDVSGKGVSAALLMATSLSQFDASMALKLTPTERLVYLDQALLPYTKPRRQNCALCYVELVGVNTVRPVLKVVNAGCIPPYLKHADGSVEWADIGGFALGQGLGAQVGYQEISHVLAKGDMVILTSDGLVEAGNAAAEMFGFERLEQAIRTGPTISAQAMLDHLRATLAAFVGSAEPHDDITIVVAQV